MLPKHAFLLFLLHCQLQTILSSKPDTSFFHKCMPSRCNPSGPEIRFPYRLNNSSPEFCSLPGMVLACSPHGETLLAFPNMNATQVRVRSIDYKHAYLTVEIDKSWPSCLLNLSTVNLTSALYWPRTENISLLTCPAKLIISDTSFDSAGTTCLGGTDMPNGYTYYAVSPTELMDNIPSECTSISNNMQILTTTNLRERDWNPGTIFDSSASTYREVPLKPPSVSFQEALNDLLVRRLVRLNWFLTTDALQCLECENRGRLCGYDIITKSNVFCKPRCK